jgi:glycosyltransferase involved in cell wall biosynthesis
VEAGAASPRVRFVLPRFGSGILGGAEGLARRQAIRLAASGWKAEVWATTAEHEATWQGHLPSAETDCGVSVRRFPLARTRNPAIFRQASRAFFRLPSVLRAEGWWVRAQGPYSPQLIAALRGAEPLPTLFAPYLYHTTLAGVAAAPRPRVLVPAAHDERPLRLRVVRRAIEACDAIWYHTDEERQLLEGVHPVAASKPQAVGTVGLDPSQPGDAARFRARFGIENPFVFFAGRTASGKGQVELLQAYSALQRQRTDISLVVAGETAASRPPAGVISTGPLDAASLHDALAAATAVVVPGRMESLSMLALEAWGAGRPCILNGSSAVLAGQARRSGGALLFTDAASFATAVTAVVDDGSLAARLGAAGQGYVAANYRWDDVVLRLQRLIASVG